MSKMYEAAIARRAELMKELNELGVFISMYKKLSGEKPARPRRKARVKPSAWLTSVEQIIVANGKPMTSPAIAEALAKGGKPVESDKPAAYIANKLWRSDHFINLDSHGYWPSSMPYEPANYSPR